MMDHFNDRVPIRTVGGGTHYDGPVWYEPLNIILSINGFRRGEVYAEKG